ncbi:dynein axonemal intermediate chain 4-like [Argiope bruennichi]|uniref:dynein axonemal intermediate chain 4-like n=1 Tax=Argiope bruennichi TaxID=94029 RepID=UPI002494C668|nr:dynein axonemal intermediate chain 4-like [Argiope bruennichi]
MTVKDIILDWLEEGFAFAKNIQDIKVSHESSLLPSIKNESGVIITPKPLFPIFLEDVELDPNFLIEYFEVIENMLQLKKNASKNIDGLKTIEKGDSNSHLESDMKKKLNTPIDYERKNIFLSRVVFSVFELPDCLVPKTSSQYEKVLRRNELYKRAIDLRRDFPIHFHDQNTQEGCVKMEDKSVETIPIILNDKTTLVNNYKMKEHYDENEIVLKPPPKSFKEYINNKTKFQNYKDFIGKIHEYPSILSRIKNSLYVMEKSLNYNTYKSTLLSYNNCAVDLEELMKSSEKENIESSFEKIRDGSGEYVRKVSGMAYKHHLQFFLPSLKDDYRVTCMECNPKNSSIFISGYGVPPSKELDSSPRGMVLCWNIHKCEHPERIYHTEEAVECVQFSKTKPYLIAAGMRYGLITVFDLRRSDSRSKVNNRTSTVRPNGTITSVRWIQKKYSLGKESEFLLAISMDGLLTTWNLGKTLDGYILRTVKRGTNIGQEQRRLFIAADAAGMCLQMKPDDSNVFVLGTIEGQALQGEFNDPEEYVHVYNCHNGPVYDIQWSPIVTDIFMTCGADRKVSIWDIQRTMTSKTVSLPDVTLKMALSNIKSTLFVLLTKKVIYVFDLAVHLHKPLIELHAKEEDLFSCVIFCSNNNWILVGGSSGIINLYELTNVSELPGDQSAVLKETLISEL